MANIVDGKLSRDLPVVRLGKAQRHAPAPVAAVRVERLQQPLDLLARHARPVSILRHVLEEDAYARSHGQDLVAYDVLPVPVHLGLGDADALSGKAVRVALAAEGVAAEAVDALGGGVACSEGDDERRDLDEAHSNFWVMSVSRRPGLREGIVKCEMYPT